MLMTRHSQAGLAALLPLLSLLLLSRPPAARAETEPLTIGYVKTLSGTASLSRDGVAQPIQTGTAIREKDWVETGPDGSVGITFRDNTRIALGPRSRIALDRFAFAPAEKHYGFVVRVVRGTLEYISGLMAKLAPEAVSIETPTSTVGVRGTRFLLRVEG